MHKMFSSIPGLYPLGASWVCVRTHAHTHTPQTPPSFDNQKCLQTLLMTVGAKSLLVGNC